MNRTEARAIVALSKAVLKACKSCRSKLSPDLLPNADAYWLGHLEGISKGYGHGSIPVARVQELLGDFSPLS